MQYVTNLLNISVFVISKRRAYPQEHVICLSLRGMWRSWFLQFYQQLEVLLDLIYKIA